MTKKEKVLVFLVGMPGSGKSYWVRALSEHLSLPFLDMDAFIESSVGSTISDLFVKGEQYFREEERKALLHLINHTQSLTLVATGGGAPCYSNNMEMMLRHGHVVYLNASIDEIVTNLKNAKVERPLLKDTTETDLYEKLSGLYHKRQAEYEKSHLTLDVSSLTLANFAAVLKQLLHS